MARDLEELAGSGNQKARVTIHIAIGVVLELVAHGGVSHSVVISGESQAEQDDLEHACAMPTRGRPSSNQINGRVVVLTWIPGVMCQIRQCSSHVGIS